MNVTVIGMGKIGLPLAVNFARNGANVTGLDNQVEVKGKKILDWGSQNSYSVSVETSL